VSGFGARLQSTSQKAQNAPANTSDTTGRIRRFEVARSQSETAMVADVMHARRGMSV
jgi:hypothetical protein